MIFINESQWNSKKDKNNVKNSNNNFFDFQLCDTPLHMACKFGFIGVAKYLLSFKPLKVNATNTDGQTAQQVIHSILTLSHWIICTIRPVETSLFGQIVVHCSNIFAELRILWVLIPMVDRLANRVNFCFWVNLEIVFGIGWYFSTFHFGYTRSRFSAFTKRSGNQFVKSSKSFVLYFSPLYIRSWPLSVENNIEPWYRV